MSACRQKYAVPFLLYLLIAGLLPFLHCHTEAGAAGIDSCDKGRTANHDALIRGDLSEEVLEGSGRPYHLHDVRFLIDEDNAVPRSYVNLSAPALPHYGITPGDARMPDAAMAVFFFSGGPPLKPHEFFSSRHSGLSPPRS